MNVFIINPTYNEKGNIEKLISILEEDIFPHIKNHEMNILVADDGSPDGTGDLVRQLMKKYKNLYLLEGKKQGLGAAYKRAMTYAIEKLGADVVFEMDADLQHDPAIIPQFLKKIDEGYDFVIGSRYMKGGGIPENWGIDRKIYSILGNIIIRSILMRWNPKEWTNGYRAIRKEVFLKEQNKLALYNGYVFQVSFLHMALQDKFKVAEIPFVFKDRQAGKSKIASGSYMIDIFKYLFVARFKELERFIKFVIVGGTGFVVQLIFQEGSIRTGFTDTLANAVSNGIDLFYPHTDIISLSHALGAGIGAEAAIISNFLFNNSWTFQDTKHVNNSSFLMRLLKFNLSSIAAIIIQFVAVWIGEKLFGSQVLIQGLFIPTRILVVIPTIIFIVIPINYLIYNKIIWKTHLLTDEKK